MGEYVLELQDFDNQERESQDSAAASHQMALDVLYRVGCQYNVKDADMRALCDLALINFNELQLYSGSSHIFNTSQRNTHHEHRNNDFGAKWNRQDDQPSQYEPARRAADSSGKEAASLPL